MKKYAPMLMVLILLFGCRKNKAQVESKPYGLMLNTLLSHSVPELSVGDARQQTDFVFVDAREREEYDVSQIRDAVWVGYDSFDASGLKQVSRDQPLVVYCSVGYRSEKIAEQLRDLGYNDVYNLYGGIFEWVNQGQPVYDGKQQTDTVHAYDKAWGIWLNKGIKVYK